MDASSWVSFESAQLGQLCCAVLASLGLAGGMFELGARMQAGESRLSERLKALDKDLRFLRAGISARTLVLVQTGLASSLLWMAVYEWSWALAALFVVVAPHFCIRRARVRRSEAIGRQVEGWMVILGRALEAAPSLGEAIEVSVGMSEAPLRDELRVVVSEMNLGTPLDEALANWDERVKSTVLSLALGTIKIGRQTGGRLGEVLTTSAESLREMERLEGLIRTKTAEGRAQAWVIGIVPFPLYFVVKWGDPEYFRPFETTALGHVLVGSAAILWVAAILSAKKILAVRI